MTKSVKRILEVKKRWYWSIYLQYQSQLYPANYQLQRWKTDESKGIRTCECDSHHIHIFDLLFLPFFIIKTSRIQSVQNRGRHTRRCLSFELNARSAIHDIGLSHGILLAAWLQQKVWCTFGQRAISNHWPFSWKSQKGTTQVHISLQMSCLSGWHHMRS